MSDICNSSHRNLYKKGYFEWWYFHFLAPEISLNLVLHETDIFGLRRGEYVSMSVLDANTEPRYYKREIEGCSISVDDEFLGVGDQHISFDEDSDALNFDLRFGNDVKFYGKILKSVRGFVVNGGVLTNGTEGENSFWVVQVPCGCFDAVLRMDGLERKIKGLAYQDHQWGDFLLQNAVSDWVWGHFANDDISVVFFRILTQGGELIDRFGLVEKESMLKGTVLKTEFLDTFSGLRDPSMAELGMKVGAAADYLLEFSIAPGAIMRSRLNEKLPDFVASYLRWFSKGLFVTGFREEKLRGVVEYLRIRK